MKIISTFVLALLFGSVSLAAVRVQMKIENGKATLLSAQSFSQKAVTKKKLLRKLPYYLREDQPSAAITFEEYEIPDAEVTPAVTRALQKSQLSIQRLDARTADIEMRPLIVQGPKANRINLTILGDGYTLAEKEKFFADAKRSMEGLFVGKTFESYLPLFNVYAVYVPSNKSGIGEGRPQDTAFQLYRDPAGSKRAIMPGDEAALESALKHSPATDYPIVLANDDFYGGLGGRWAISTSSARSGLIVLRHELGHNFGEVGEEYDNGYVYSGANSSRSATALPWKHWVDGSTEVHEAKLISGNYVWQNLKHGYQTSFKIPKQMGLLFFSISSVGWQTAGDVSLMLNGQPLPITGKFHEDRAFYEPGPFPVQENQNYSLEVKENIADGNNVLGFAIAYAAPANYNFTPEKVGAFASYDTNGSKSYRPTHQSCLMRSMEVENFCVVDQENMWHKFLNRVTLIDEVLVEKNMISTTVKVSLKAQPLKGLQVSWFQVLNGKEQELTQFRDQLQWESAELKGSFKVKVKFETPEVRKYSPRFEGGKAFEI